MCFSTLWPFSALSVEGGYVHAGASGAGHFVKLVHNGIEFGMLQAIGEGIDLLEHYHDKLDVAEVLRCWRHGSVIRSWLVDLMEAAYREQQRSEIARRNKCGSRSHHEARADHRRSGVRRRIRQRRRSRQLSVDGARNTDRRRDILVRTPGATCAGTAP